MKLTYREDIDGLRAISVLAVILNHAGIGLFSGGYVGVDIFFVISGYLITSIIVREIDLNNFSIIRFYERRIRRILPALFVLIAFTIAVCALIYDAEKFKEFGKSVVATTLFASNINFWRESGYFDAPSQLKPLLHTWSLAVEEQFYIFFPLFMYLIFRFARKFAPIILIGVAVISLGFSIYTVSKDPSTAFYLAHLRAWELLIGAILALHIIPESIRKTYGNIIGILGLIMILLPIFQYSGATKFPGIAALPPVLGAAFIIFSGINGEKSFTGRLLSLPPLVFTGTISYSLYLWHWPLIIFSKYYAIRALTTYELSGILVAVIIISTLSWRFIETPFRTKKFLGTKPIYSLAAIGIILLALSGWGIYHFRGFPERNGLEYLQRDNKKEKAWAFEECNINATDDPKGITPCFIGNGNAVPSFMIWGDSHAPTYGKAIHAAASANGVSGILTYGRGCPSLLDMVPTPQTGDVLCEDYNRMVVTYLKQHPEITTIILANRWTIWLEGTRYKQEEGTLSSLADDLSEFPEQTPNNELFAIGLQRTIKALLDMDRQVFVIAPLPEIGYDVPSTNFIAARTGRDVNQIIAPTIDEYLIRNKQTLSILKKFEETYGIRLIEPWKFLCQDNVCRAVVDGVPLYIDDDHLSVFGSEFITPVFDPLFH